LLITWISNRSTHPEGWANWPMITRNTPGRASRKSFVIDPPKGINLRCSRPLCSSQNTGGTPTTGDLCRQAEALEVPVPTPRANREPMRPESLRTQQRAHPNHPEANRSTSPKEPYWVRTDRIGINVNVPPMSYQPETCAPDLAPGHHLKPEREPGTASCSLERRWSSRTFRYGYLVTT